MIRIILHGCSGRMGQVITSLISTMPDMNIVAGIDIVESVQNYPIYPTVESCPVEADVLIDFSLPHTLHTWLPATRERNIAVVTATTGLGEKELSLIQESATDIPIFRSANMSVGINLVQQLLQQATKVLGDRYDIEIIEKHHNQKKDAPSGTALMLADSINAVRLEKLTYVNGREGADCKRTKQELGIHSIRGGTIVGQHDVLFSGQDEIITIGHQAFSRQVFAMGAIAATTYIMGKKPGLYSMQDMINESRAITTMYRNDDVVLISCNHLQLSMKEITRIYQVLAENDIFIDMISHTGSPHDELSLSFTIHAQDKIKTEAVLNQLDFSQTNVLLTVQDQLTKITVEGPGMEFQSGIAYRVFSYMAESDITILAVTTSENKISYVVSEGEADRATSIIRREFSIFAD